MQHIYKIEEGVEHNVGEDTTCECCPRVFFVENGEMLVIHKSSKGEDMSDDDIKGLLAFVNDDPEYGGGNLIVGED